ncbi:MAG: hypothetical protein ACRDKT_02565 [Actinomycetota bacterium]
MRAAVAIAGLITVALGIGHETLGQLRVLPRLGSQEPMSSSPSMMDLMIRVTWHIVTLFALTSGGLLLSLARAPDVDAETLVLRWFAAMWAVAAVMAFVIARRGRHDIRRLPIPVVWVVVAVLCWVAST